MFTRENYLIRIQSFEQSIWDTMNKSEKESLLQWIVDYEANQFGVDSICHVKIDKLGGGSQIGQFNDVNKAITIEEDLALRGLKPPYHIKNNNRLNPTRELDVYSALMHEFRHAIQTHIKNHLHTLSDTKYSKLMKYNSKQTIQQLYKGYFEFNNRSGDNFAKSDLLYKLQPSERDAFMYRDKKMKDFMRDMHFLFPDKYPSWSSNDGVFQQTVVKAKERYETNQPFKDIDNIILAINEGYSSNNLNQKMFQDIVDTQQLSVIDKINNALQNKKINLDECFSQQNMQRKQIYIQKDMYSEITDEAYDELYQDRE